MVSRYESLFGHHCWPSAVDCNRPWAHTPNPPIDEQPNHKQLTLQLEELQVKLYDWRELLWEYDRDDWGRRIPPWHYADERDDLEPPAWEEAVATVLHKSSYLELVKGWGLGMDPKKMRRKSCWDDSAAEIAEVGAGA